MFGGIKMNINDFAKIVTLLEGKKRSVSIAQVKEILKIINDLTEKEFYKSIRKLDKEKIKI
jgi:hypothetical protein